jgi:hypothetical protein
MLQIKVMEVTQQLQSVQDKACMLFTEVKSQGAELEQVVLTAEQCLEVPVNYVVIHELSEQEATTKKQVEVAQGIRGRIDQTGVTRDESQASVGDL